MFFTGICRNRPRFAAFSGYFFFYHGGFEISSEYDAEAFEVSLSGVLEIVTEELVIPFLLIPIYLYYFISRRKRFDALRLEIKSCNKEDSLFVLEKEVNVLIENRKIKTIHGLILRNAIEEKENSIREQQMPQDLEEEE